jgi:hypothetical protein
MGTGDGINNYAAGTGNLSARQLVGWKDTEKRLYLAEKAGDLCRIHG